MAPRDGAKRGASDEKEWIARLAGAASSREDFWIAFLRDMGATTAAEIGVYRGRFAERLLRECPEISAYFLIDPWRHLDDWNKPANKSQVTFDRFLKETMERTEPYAEKRVILRGTTAEVSTDIADDSLDFAYIDGDHTLRGITIDLVRIFPKVRKGGWIGGDDFCASIWQHGREFEPTLVFPVAVHFAEAVGTTFYCLPRRQFLMRKGRDEAFEFVDLTGKFLRSDLKSQLLAREEASSGTAEHRRLRRGFLSGLLRAAGTRLTRRTR